MNAEDLEIVAEDLQYLAEWGPNISDQEIRRGSAVLRRLLIEDVYGHAWRTIGKKQQPKLIAVDISNLTRPDKLSSIVYVLAAGAHFRGVQLACMLLNKGNSALDDGFGPPIREHGYPGEKELSLSEYLASNSGAVGGRTFTRREVIKYIANVRGGVHLSQKQRKAEKKLIARLGKIEKQLTVHTTDGLLVELVAIGQAVGMSENAKELVNSIRQSKPNN